MYINGRLFLMQEHVQANFGAYTYIHISLSLSLTLPFLPSVSKAGEADILDDAASEPGPTGTNTAALCHHKPKRRLRTGQSIVKLV